MSPTIPLVVPPFVSMCALVNIPLDFDAICVTYAVLGGDLGTGGCFWRFAINLDDYRGDGERVWMVVSGTIVFEACGLVRGCECYIVN